MKPARAATAEAGTAQKLAPAPLRSRREASPRNETTGPGPVAPIEALRPNHTVAGPVPAPRRTAAATPAVPLPATLRNRLAPIVGSRAVEAARLHTGPDAGARARAHNARALAEGEHIYFGEGQFRPGTREGDALIAHEIAHVDQAQRGLLREPARKALGAAVRTPLENSADEAADQLTAGADLDELEKTRRDRGKRAHLKLLSSDETPAARPPGAAAPDSAAAAPEEELAADEAGEASADAAEEELPAEEGEVGPADALPPGLPLMPEPVVELSPVEQHRVAGVQGRAGSTARATATAPVATENVAVSKATVLVPQTENDARAAEKLVAELAEKQKPSPEIVALCERIRTLIRDKRPADEDAVIDSRPQEVADSAGAAVEGDVQKDVDGAKASYGPMAHTPTGPQSDTPKDIEALPVEVAAPAVNAGAATPDAIPPEQVDLEGDAREMDAKAEKAGLEGESAQLVEDGPVGEARDARGEMKTLSKDGPAEALKQQTAALAQADTDMAALQSKALASLRQARTGHVGGVKAQQGTFKGGEEGMRADLSRRAEDVFTAAQGQVEELLRDVPTVAMKKWTTELPFISRQFNAALKVVKDRIADRHSGVGGFFVSGWDAVTGLPGWAEDGYDKAEREFGDSVCTLITGISSYVNGIIAVADGIIAKARSDIHDIFTRDLPAGLAEFAATQEKEFGKKLDVLHNQAEKTRTSFNKELIENAGGAVQSARESVQKLRKEAGGLWGRFLAAVGAFLDDPIRFIINGLLSLVGISPPSFWGVVAKIIAYATDIALSPLRFANNLMDGISAGFSLFFDHIGRHLIEGFLEWLLSGLEDEGIAIEIPKEVSVRSVVGFFLQLLGISWIRIRKLMVEQLGEKAVAVIEKTGGAFYALATKGISGIYDDVQKMLEPQTIIDAVIDAAVKYITETLIVRVAAKIILMLNPAGAILAAIEAIYRVLKWIFLNAAKIFHLIEAVVNGIGDILSGNIGGVAKMVEGALARLVSPVIDFLADYLGLGGLPGKVAKAIKGLQSWVEGVLRRVIKWLVDLGKKILAALGFGGREDKKPQEVADDGVGARVPFSGAGESHALYFVERGNDAILMVASDPMKVEQRLDDFEGRARGDGKQLPFFSDDRKRDRALALITRARSLVSKTDADADSLVREHRAKAKIPAKTEADASTQGANAHVVEEEQSLAALLSELYELFGEKPGEVDLNMRAAYSGAIGSGELSFKRRPGYENIADVIGSGPVVGAVAGARRGRITLEAAALTNALVKQVEKKIVDPPKGLNDWLADLQKQAEQTEAIASEALKKREIPQPPTKIQSALEEDATLACKVAGVKLLGGGEIVERAMTQLVDAEKQAAPRGVFATVAAMDVEITRATAAAREAARSAKPTDSDSSGSDTVAKSTTLQYERGPGLVPKDEALEGPALVAKKTGAEVAAFGNYEEIVGAVRKTADGFGPALVRAIHDVPAGPINARMRVKLRGREITKDQDKFLSEVELLVRIEMVRATSAWAFLVPQLLAAKTSVEVADAFSATVFPHAQVGFVAQYRKWGPKVFDEASSALFQRLGAEFKHREGLVDGEQLFLAVDEINAGIRSVKDKLKVIYDEALTKA